MEKENRLKSRISRMFRGSFGSCRTRDISDVIENSAFMPEKMDCPKNLKPIPSLCKPRCPDPSMNINSIISCKKILNPYPHFLPSGHSCPPVSPASPFFLNHKRNTLNKIDSNSTFKPNFSIKQPSHTTKNKRRHYTAPLSSSSQSSAYYADKYYNMFSSEEDEEEEDNDESDAFFSSRSTTLTSDSSGSYYRSTRRKRSGSRKKKKKKRSSNVRRRASKMGVLPFNDVEDGGGSVKVKDSFAVVKKSSDPYNDFRTSMVEMIVEKHIFSSAELEKLLQCFLSLNSFHHHKIIVEVFMEIWETLFSHCS